MDTQISDASGDSAAPQKHFAVVKRSVIVSGQKTSVSLEDAFWVGLKDIAASRGVSLSRLLAAIEADRSTHNLSSAIRLYVLAHFRTRASFPVMIGERWIDSPPLVPGINPV